MTYEQWKHEKEAKRLEIRTTGKILSKKPIPMSKFLDLAAETAKSVEKHENARKNGKSAFERAYNGQYGSYRAPVKPPESTPDPNRAFRRLKGHKRTQEVVQSDVEAAIKRIEEDEMKELKEEDEWGYDIDDEDDWDEDETNQV